MNTHGLFLSVKVLLQAFLLTGRGDLLAPPLLKAFLLIGRGDLLAAPHRQIAQPLLKAFLLTGRGDIPLCWAYVFVG